MPDQEDIQVWEGDVSNSNTGGVLVIKPVRIRVYRGKSGYYSRAVKIPMLCSGSGDTIAEAAADTVDAMADQLRMLLPENPDPDSLSADLKAKLLEHIKFI